MQKMKLEFNGFYLSPRCSLKPSAADLVTASFIHHGICSVFAAYLLIHLLLAQ